MQRFGGHASRQVFELFQTCIAKFNGKNNYMLAGAEDTAPAVTTSVPLEKESVVSAETEAFMAFLFTNWRKIAKDEETDNIRKIVTATEKLFNSLVTPKPKKPANAYLLFCKQVCKDVTNNLRDASLQQQRYDLIKHAISSGDFECDTPPKKSRKAPKRISESEDLEPRRSSRLQQRSEAMVTEGDKEQVEEQLKEKVEEQVTEVGDLGVPLAKAGNHLNFRHWTQIKTRP